MESSLAYQDDWREEQIGGEWVAMAPATTSHNVVKGNIHGIFWGYLRGHTCQVLPDGEAVCLTDEDYYYPDVMIVCDPEKIKEDGVYGAPDLVVEVLSPGTARYDRGRKKDIYEKARVREYWLVNPVDKSVEQWLFRGGRFVLNNIYSVYPDFLLARMKESERANVTTEFKCSLYDDLTIRLDDIFARVK